MFPLLLGICLPLVITVPQSSQGHGTEFIMARVQIDDSSRTITLRLAVDSLSNPLIADEAAAEQALQKALLVIHQGQTTPFAELAPLNLESVESWDDSLPASLIPPPDGQEHQLLIATWKWQPDSQEIAFSVAKGSRNDVLLWRQTDEGLKSVFLLAGDVSPPLVLPPPASEWNTWWWLFPSTLVVGLAGLRRRPPKLPVKT